MYGKTKSSSVMEIEVKTKGPYSRVSSRSEVDDGIISETDERLHLTDNTPFLSEKVINYFGLICEGLETNRFLEGSFIRDEFSNISSLTKELLKAFKKKRKTEVSSNISQQYFLGYW